jgi:hypothetical protein
MNKAVLNNVLARPEICSQWLRVNFYFLCIFSRCLFIRECSSIRRHRVWPPTSPFFPDISCIPWIYGFVILKSCSGPIKRNVNNDYNTMFCNRGCSSVVERLNRNQKASGLTPDISIFWGQLMSPMDLWICHVKILFWSN